MSNNPYYQGFIEELIRVAPDLDASTISADEHLMIDLGIDSMDFLNLVIALHKRYGISIAEADYPQLATAALAADHLASKLADS